MNNRLLKSILTITYFFLCLFCEAQYSQIILMDGKTLVMKEMEYTNRILFLKRISTHNGPFAEIMEFKLTPSDSSFIQRSSIQLSSDSTDYWSPEEYTSRLKAARTTPAKGDSIKYMPVIGFMPHSDKELFGNIPEEYWNNPRVLDLRFLNRDSLISYSVDLHAGLIIAGNYSSYLFLENGKASRLEYDHSNIPFYPFQYCQGSSAYYNLKTEKIIQDELNLAKKISENLTNKYNNYKHRSIEKAIEYEIERDYNGAIWTMPNLIGLPNIYSKIYEENKYLISKKDRSSNSVLRQRELFSNSENWSMLTLICDERLEFFEASEVEVNQAFRILRIVQNRDGSLNKTMSYSLPADMLFRTWWGSDFPPVKHERDKQILPRFAHFINLFSYFKAIDNACVDTDGTLNVFAYKGKLPEEIYSNPYKIRIESVNQEELPSSGLFLLRPNGKSKFIPHDELFDQGVYRDSTVAMIQTKNESHWLIGQKSQDKRMTKMLMVQEPKSKKFITHCTLPLDFEPLYLSEVSENVIAICGEQIGNSSNKSFLPNKTKVNSVLIVDVDELKPKRSMNKLKVTQVDLKSGHVYCSDLKREKAFFFPIILNTNDSGKYQGVLLLDGTEVSFAKDTMQLEVDGKMITSEASNLEGVLTEVINYYFNKK
jgi:hypothetical protein